MIPYGYGIDYVTHGKAERRQIKDDLAVAGRIVLKQGYTGSERTRI